MDMLVSGQEMYDEATKLLQKPNVNFQELEKCFNDFCILIDTAYTEEEASLAPLWFQLGAVCIKRNHKLLGLMCFENVLKHDPDFLEAINNCGFINKKFNLMDDAKKWFKQGIDLIEQNKVKTNDITKSEFLTNYGSMFVGAGKADEAIDYFNRAEKLNSEHKLIKYNRGLAFLEKGIYKKGFEGYNVGERVEKIVRRNYGRDSLPEWDGTKGKNLVVVGEQGIGDELMFATILPDLAKDCEFVFDAHPRLADMFRRSFPNLEIYGTRKDDHIDWGRRYKLDAKVLIGSLPAYYRHKRKDFPREPYLIVDPKYDQRYAERLTKLGDKPKVGISWRGGTKGTGQSSRYIPLEKWLDILKLDCDFISLQYDTGISKDIEDFNKKNEVNLMHWPEMVEDYEQTAACVKNLDLIISVPQSVIHLSGVIGITPTWQLCPVRSLWQCGVHGHNMPWYQNTQNYWQEKDGEWDNVLIKVREDLCKLLQMNTAA